MKGRKTWYYLSRLATLLTVQILPRIVPYRMNEPTRFRKLITQYYTDGVVGTLKGPILSEWDIPIVGSALLGIKSDG